MYDILVYLFENYFPERTLPETRELIRKLSTLGFDNQNIELALAWLSGVDSYVALDVSKVAPAASSLRLFHAVETSYFGTECLDYLLYLEKTQVIDSLMRESIIECVMNSPEDDLSLGKFKILLLMVLWKHGEDVSPLLSDELLTLDEGDDDESEFLEPLLETLM